MNNTIYTPSAALVKVLTTSSVATSFAAVASTTTQPSGAGIFNLNNSSTFQTTLSGGMTWNNLYMELFGLGADNETVKARVWGLKHASGLWRATLLAGVTGTLSAYVGVSGATVGATERWADTITLDYGTDNVDVVRGSNALDYPAHVLIDLKGHQWVWVQPIRGTAATSANGLIAPC